MDTNDRSILFNFPRSKHLYAFYLLFITICRFYSAFKRRYTEIGIIKCCVWYRMAHVSNIYTNGTNRKTLFLRLFNRKRVKVHQPWNSANKYFQNFISDVRLNSTCHRTFVDQLNQFIDRYVCWKLFSLNKKLLVNYIIIHLQNAQMFFLYSNISFLFSFQNDINQCKNTFT